MTEDAIKTCSCVVVESAEAPSSDNRYFRLDDIYLHRSIARLTGREASEASTVDHIVVFSVLLLFAERNIGQGGD